MNVSRFGCVFAPRSAALAAFLALAAGHALAQPQVIPIYYPGTTNDPYGVTPQCISGDGFTVYGDTGTSGLFVWTEPQGSVFLPISDSNQVHIAAVSRDGAVAAGRTSVSVLGRVPTMWINRQRIIMQSFGAAGEVLGMSADGSTLVGDVYGSNGWQHAAAWTDPNTLVPIDPGTLWYKSSATDASLDGSVIVGSFQRDSSATDRQVFLHTTSGTVEISPPLDYTFPFPRPYSALGETVLITDDGSTIIAQWQQPGTGWNRVFKYTISNGQWNSIGLPPNEVSVLVTAANAHGSMIAGFIQRHNQFVGSVWTQQTGWFQLNEYLIGEGLPTLADPVVITGVSDDRLSLCAWTGDQRGWVVRFDTACRADYDRSGTLDFTDYLTFVQDWSQELPGADFNRDRTIDFFDYLDFVAAFDLGCT